MKEPCRLSNVTKDYLTEFHCILEEMIQGMTEVQFTDSISHNFIVQMIPHHRAAIDMSCNLLQYTTDLALQDIAENIITEQTKSIKNMENILCTCKSHTNPERALYVYQTHTDRIMQTMFREMRHTCSDNNINTNFMREMIPHHKGAIRMSKNTLCYDICPGLVPILRSIISSQEKGVAEMEHLLQVSCPTEFSC